MDRAHQRGVAGARVRSNERSRDPLLWARLAVWKVGLVSTLAQFCAVGASGVVVDPLTFRSLLVFGWPLEVARAIAVWTAMTPGSQAAPSATSCSP
jgi:hypothetical protein